MLVLSRRVGEKIIINDQITVTVLGIKGRQVRIGFEAPADVSIHRSEVYEKILQDRQDADEPKAA